MANHICIFCGAAADTEEHVIPQWMHADFGIKHQSLKLCNGTTIKYLREKVPACRTCNNERFSRLEERVKSDTASDQDLYVWAAKMYWGLNQKDSTLSDDRSDPTRGTILTDKEAVKGVGFLGTILANYGRVGFTLYPCPFGSAVRIDLPASVASGFGLCSIGFPYHVITISLTSRKLLTVLLNDRALTQRGIKAGVLSGHSSVDRLATVAGVEMTANTYAKFLTLHYCRMKSRVKVPGGLILTARRVAATRLPNNLRTVQCDDAAVTADVVGKLFDFVPAAA